MNCKAFITDCAGHALNAEERAFLRAEQPWGFILFARNIETPDQVRALCDDVRGILGRSDAPILIDQEGGRVQRLRPPHWENYPAAATLGALYQQKQDQGLRAAWLLSRLHAHDLLEIGVNVDCLPVLDIPSPDGHEIIGDRAYGKDADSVADMGRAACEGLRSGGVMPVIKHIPGHGRATADSHHDLPVVDTDRPSLEASDFEPFRRLNDQPMAMTAHVIYSAIDADNPATTSPEVIGEIIRGSIGFDGLLMSDDLSMKALSGDYPSRCQSVFAAGCDVVLHCNGTLEERRIVGEACIKLQGKSLQRASLAMVGAGERDNFDAEAARAELATLLQGIAVG